MRPRPLSSVVRLSLLSLTGGLLLHAGGTARMLKRAYVPTVDFALARPKLTIAAAAGVTVVGLGLGGHAGRGLPAADLRGGLGRRCLASPSTSLSQAIALGRETEIAPRESPEVATVINRIGRPARIGHKQQVEAAEPTASEGASI